MILTLLYLAVCLIVVLVLWKSRHSHQQFFLKLTGLSLNFSKENEKNQGECLKVAELINVVKEPTAIVKKQKLRRKNVSITTFFEHQDTLKKWSDPTPSTTSKAKNSKDNLSIPTHKSAPESQESRANLSVVDVFSVEPKCSLGKRESQSHEVSSEPSIMTNDQVFSNDASPIDPTNCSNYLPSADKAPFVDSEAINELNELAKSSCLLGSANYGDCKQITSTSEVWNDSIAVVTSTDESRTDKIDNKNLIQCQISENVALSPHTVSSVVSKLCGSESSSSTISNTSAAVDKISAADIRPVGQNPTTNLPELVAKSDKIKPELLGSAESSKGPIQPQDEAVDTEPLDIHAEQRTSLPSDKSSSTPDKLEGESDSFMNNADTNQMNDLNMTGRTEVSKNEDPAEDGHLNITCLRLNAKLTELEVSATEKAESTCSLSTMPSSHFILKGYELNNRSLDVRFNDKDEKALTGLEEDSGGEKSWNQFSNLLNNIEDIINNIDIRDNSVELEGGGGGGGVNSECPYANNPCGTRATSAQAASVYGKEEENVNNCLESSAQQLQPLGSASASVSVSKAIDAFNNLHSYESCYSSMNAINKLLQPSYNPILTYQCRNLMKDLNDSDLKDSLKIATNREVTAEIVEQNLARRLDKSNKSSGGDRKPSLNEQNADLGGKLHSNSSLSRSLLFHDLNGAGVASESSSYDIVDDLRSREEDETEERGVEEEEEEEEDEEPTIEDFSEDSALARLDFQLSSSSETLLNDELSHEFESEKIAEFQSCESLVSAKNKLDILNNSLINNNEIIKTVLSATSSLDFINDDFVDIFKEDESISSDENSFIMNELSILNEDAESKNVLSLPSSTDSTSSLAAEDVSLNEVESLSSSILSSESYETLNPINLVNGGGTNCSYSWVYEGSDDTRFEPDFTETEHMLLSLNLNSNCNHFVKSKLNTILECDEHNSVDSVEINGLSNSLTTDLKDEQDSTDDIDYSSELPHPSNLEKYLNQDAVEKCSWSKAGGDVKLTSFSTELSSTSFISNESDVDQHDVDPKWSRAADVKISILNRKNNALSKLKPVNPIVLNESKLSGFAPLKKNNCSTPPTYLPASNKIVTDESDELKFSQTDREEYEIDVINNCISASDPTPGIDLDLRSLEEPSNVVDETVIAVMHPLLNANSKNRLSENCNLYENNATQNVGAYDEDDDDDDDKEEEEEGDEEEEGVRENSLPAPGNCELYSLSDIDRAIDQMEEARVGANNNCGFVYNISPSERYHREFRAIANLDSASFDADEDDDDNDDDCHSSDDDGCDSEDVKISESTTNSAISEFDDSVISEFDNFMLFDSDSKLISDCNTSAISEFTDSAISEYDTSAFENSFSTLPNVNSEIISVCPENLKYFNNKHAHYPSHPSENRKSDLKDREGLKNLPDLCQTCPFTRALSDESLSDSNGGLGSKKSNDLTDRLNYNALNIIEKQMSNDDFNDDFSDSDHGIELADFESRSSNCSPDYSTNHAIVDDSKLHANQKINQNFYENLLINLDKFKNYSIKDKITYYELKTNQNYNTVSNSDKKFNILKTFGDLKSMKSSVDRRRASKILREEKKFDNDSACETLGISQVLCNDSGDNIRCSDAIRCSDNNSDWKFKYLTKSELKSLKLSDSERSFKNTREKSKSFSDIADSNISQPNRENLAFSVHLGFNKGQQYASECQIFFRSGVLAQLEMKRDEKLTDRIIKLQSHCRGFLARKKLAKLKVEDLAVRCIQRNVRKFMSVRDWAWWRLLVRVTPLLNVHRTEEELKSKTEELENLRAKVEKLEQERTLLKHETDKLETKLSEMTVDLAEEHSTATVASERLEIETSERLRLEKELQEIQGQNKRLQENGERLELEVLCLHTAEVNGSALHSEDDDDESGDRTGVYKRRYERVARELEFTKRRLQQQHQDDLEQLIGLRKQLEKKLADAYEEVEEQRQVVAQWKRKVQKLNAELNDVRLLLEEQNSRNILLEKKQRKFDAELQMLQDELRNERQQKERASRERELAVGDKYSMEQTLSAVKLELELKEQKLANLNRELEELTFNGNTEEEVANLKKSKHQLDNKIKDQEEELDDLAGQVQMLEQAKLKLEMSLEQMRKEHRRELMQKDDEIEDARCSAVKKVKALECQLESEHEERTLLLRERHELERRLNDVEDRERVNRTNDQEQLSRLRRDLKRTKALLRDAQIMLQQAKADTPNKTILRQLRNQLDDAECARNLAMKARQTAEADLMETQLALEEATRTKSEAEDKAAMISRERSQIQSQLDENEEELAEVLKKYRATVQQLSSEQSQLREQAGKIAELETERQSLKDQLSEMTSRLENVETMNDPASSLTVKRLELKCKELESKLELEQTTRSRMEVQINRLKETAERLQSDADIARGRETAAQDLVRKLQRNIRDLKEQLSQHESRENNEATRRKELEKRLEESETETSAAKSDLRLALKRIEDLQLAIQGELDHDDEDDDSPTDSDNDSASSDESFESFMTNHHSTSAERSSVSRSNFSRTEEISPLKISNSSTEAKSSSPPSSFA